MLMYLCRWWFGKLVCWCVMLLGIFVIGMVGVVVFVKWRGLVLVVVFIFMVFEEVGLFLLKVLIWEVLVVFGEVFGELFLWMIGFFKMCLKLFCGSLVLWFLVFGVRSCLIFIILIGFIGLWLSWLGGRMMCCFLLWSCCYGGGVFFYCFVGLFFVFLVGVLGGLELVMFGG